MTSTTWSGAASVSGLSVAYGRRTALREVSFSLGPGVHGLLGPNGAGKSTLMSVLATVRKPQAGSVLIAGQSVDTRAGLAAARRHLGFLPQRHRLVGSMRVLDLVAYAAWTHGVDRGEAVAGAQSALERVGLSELASRRVRALSGGQKQRCAIAAAIAHRPSLLILDEPTVGLDPQARLEFRRLIADLASDATVLLSTHLVEDLSRVASDVLVLREGRLVFDGTLGELEALGEHGSEEDWNDASLLERAYGRLLRDTA